jgi:DNA-binding MarR family transcriptional regulator
MGNIDKEYTILENIYHKPSGTRQRDLAHIAGISLGMTNAILKRLINKGFLVSKKISGKNIHYIVTPSGIKEIMQRSYAYFKRTIKDILLYKEKLEKLISEIKNQGYSTIVLVGNSDLNFIIENYCQKSSLVFRSSEHLASDMPDDVFYLISENISNFNADDNRSCFSLYEKLHDIIS